MLRTQQEKQQQKNLTENKHFYDAGKPDATCVSDSDGLMFFHEQFNVSDDDSECTTTIPSSNDKKLNLNEKKNIRIRITTNRKQPCVRKSLEMMSSESQTDTSTNEYLDTDSEVEVESFSGTTNENAVDSGGSSNTDECSDFNDFHNFESCSNDEATTTTSSGSDDSPMIQIVQEITEKRTVLSTVHVNKRKVKSFQKTRVDRVTVSSKGKPKWKNKQKIIDDNVCNEILDETIKWDVSDGEENNAIESPSVADTILVGALKAKPKYSQRTIGKLMERRLSRVLSDNVTLSPNRLSPSCTDGSTDVSSSFTAFRNTPPAKPPRTFTSSSSKASSESFGAHTATTLAIEDFHKSLPSKHSHQMSPGGGWVFDKTLRSTTKPTCPTLDELNDIEKTTKIGWVSSMQKREDFLHVLNMLNDDHAMASKITSANLTPESQIPSKEDIDQVDSCLSPKPALRRPKNRSTELNDSICSSTPVKRTNNFSSHSVPHAGHSEMEICKKCKLQIIKPSSARKSFGKGAIKRTKLFFKASKNIWIKPKSNKPVKPFENCSDNEYYVDLDYDVDVEETPSKSKLNATAEFNTNDSPRIEKKTVKQLDLTPKQSVNNIDNPRRILDKFLTSVKRTPPKKPIRQSLAQKDVTRSPSNNEEDNFNFDRVVDSPKNKEKCFKLSPRKLFLSSSEKPNAQQHNSYRSFEADDDQSDDLKQCIVDYLRTMNEKIEHKQAESESCATVPRWRSRVRNFSISSDNIDYNPERQRVVQIDCHPEPIYSEIIAQPPSNLLDHIIVNDNPKAIYAQVNKNNKNRKVITSMPSADAREIHGVIEEDIYKSNNSLDKFTINNNLTDSVLNMLERMQQQNIDNSSESDDFQVQSVGSKVKNFPFVEPPTVKLTSERFQQSVSKADDKQFDDNASIETFLTESICDDVIRGDSVNNNIVSIIDQLENMDLVSTISLVESETDDDSMENNIRTAAIITDSNGDDEYCSILEEVRL